MVEPGFGAGIEKSGGVLIADIFSSYLLVIFLAHYLQVVEYRSWLRFALLWGRGVYGLYNCKSKKKKLRAKVEPKGRER